MTEFTDSFAIYANINPNPVLLPRPADSQVTLLTRYNAIGQGNLAMGTQASPSGSMALYLPFGAAIFKTFSHQAKYTLGFRLNMDCLAGVGGGSLIDFWNCHFGLTTLIVNTDGSILVLGSPSDTPVTICSNATPGLITADVDCYVEFQCICTDIGSDINVACIVKIDNTVVASGNINIGVNKNRLVSGTADFNVVTLNSGMSTNGRAYIWDLYLTNGSGATNTGFLGSSIAPYGITSQPILPNSDSATIQWTPLSGSVHFSEINELPGDLDTSYNGNTAAGNIDSLGWQPIPTFTGTVKSVQISLEQESTEEGTCIVKSNIGAAGAEEKGAPFGLCSSYSYQHEAFDLDPATGLAWLQTDFNVKLFGYELT